MAQMEAEVGNRYMGARLQAHQARRQLVEARRPQRQLRRRLARLDELLYQVEELLAADLVEAPDHLKLELCEISGSGRMATLLDCQEAIFNSQDEVLNRLIPWRAELLAREEAAERAA